MMGYKGHDHRVTFTSTFPVSSLGLVPTGKHAMMSLELVSLGITST